MCVSNKWLGQCVESLRGLQFGYVRGSVRPSLTLWRPGSESPAIVAFYGGGKRGFSSRGLSRLDSIVEVLALCVSQDRTVGEDWRSC